MVQRLVRGAKMKRAQKRKFKSPPLQPLRIPTGWSVEWNTFFEVEPKFKSYDRISWNFGQDMLLLSNERVKVAIDLGWYPSYRSPGMFRMMAARIYDDQEQSVAAWDNPLRQRRT